MDLEGISHEMEIKAPRFHLKILMHLKGGWFWMGHQAISFKYSLNQTWGKQFQVLQKRKFLKQEEN